MIITEIAGQDVKLSDRSITVKNSETGKTKGIVKAERFMVLPCRDQIDYSKTLRSSKIWGTENLIDNVYISDKKIYFLISEKSFKYMSENKKEIINNAGKYGINVIWIR